MTNKAKHKIAIFDLDGSLVETDAANNAAYQVAFNACGLKRMCGFGERITAKAILDAGFCTAQAMEITRAKIEAYQYELWQTRLGPAASILKVLIGDRGSFRKVVLLTDSNERRAMETLRYWELDGFFDEIVCNAGEGNKYKNYFGNFDSAPEESVVWENEEIKILSAVAAGVKAEDIRKVR